MLAKRKVLTLKQQECEVRNAHQIYLDEIAVNIWNKATNCQTCKTLKNSSCVCWGQMLLHSC